jgi:dolichol-phosphate mannosyltransferase
MLWRWCRFVATGAVGFVVQMASVALVTRAGAHYLIAIAVGVEAAIVSNYLWHERWTWRDRPAAGVGTRLARLWRFNLLTGLTSILGCLAVTAALVERLGLSPLAANAVAVVLLGLLNFVGAEIWVFRAELD